MSNYRPSEHLYVPTASGRTPSAPIQKSPPLRVLVCGGRDFRDAKKLKRVLGELNIGTIIHGDAHGADRLAGRYGHFHGLKIEKYPANWKRDGKAAGPIRNSHMLKESSPDLVVAFPGGRGTADMVAKSRAAGVTVKIVD